MSDWIGGGKMKSYHYWRMSIAIVFLLPMVFVAVQRNHPLVSVVHQLFVEYPHRSIKVNNTIVPVWVADTETRRTRGLSGTETLPQGAGMLFVFENSDTYGFWMRDMKYPIDIIWLNDQFHPVYRINAAQPDSYPEVFIPPVAVRYVLETNPGEIPQ